MAIGLAELVSHQVNKVKEDWRRLNLARFEAYSFLGQHDAKPCYVYVHTNAFICMRTYVYTAHFDKVARGWGPNPRVESKIAVDFVVVLVLVLSSNVVVIVIDALARGALLMFSMRSPAGSCRLNNPPTYLPVSEANAIGIKGTVGGGGIHEGIGLESQLSSETTRNDRTIKNPRDAF